MSFTTLHWIEDRVCRSFLWFKYVTLTVLCPAPAYCDVHIIWSSWCFSNIAINYLASGHTQPPVDFRHCLSVYSIMAFMNTGAPYWLTDLSSGIQCFKVCDQLLCLSHCHAHGWNGLLLESELLQHQLHLINDNNSDRIQTWQLAT